MRYVSMEDRFRFSGCLPRKDGEPVIWVSELTSCRACTHARAQARTHAHAQTHAHAHTQKQARGYAGIHRHIYARAFVFAQLQT